MYCKLAAFLASYNELGIDAVFATERFHSGKSAVQLLEDVAISWEAQERWARVYVDDQWHRVSGNDGRSRIAESCADARCFHVPRQPLEY